MFYQLGLRQFGNFARLKLDPPAPLRALIALAVDAEQNTELSKLSKPQIVDVREFFITRPAIAWNSLIPFFSYSPLRIYLSLEETC